MRASLSGLIAGLVATSAVAGSGAVALANSVTDLRQTRISSFSVGPTPAYSQKGIRFSGQVQVRATTGWEPAVDAGVEIYYLPRGTKQWLLAQEIPADGKGDFSSGGIIIPGLAGGALWQARVNPIYGFGYAPSRSGTVFDRLGYRMWFARFGVDHVRTGVHMIGGLLWACPKADSCSTDPDRHLVKVYFKARGSRTWKLVGQTWADSQGYFIRADNHIRPAGWWQVRFSGDANSFPTTSKSVYVPGR